MNQEETIFEQALEMLSPQARDAFVREACTGNQALLERIQALLQVHDRSGKFLEHVRSASEAPISIAPSGTTSVATDIKQQTERIGRYKLLQKIGEGGCGVVYMAEQQEPVRRRVALKIIKLGMDTRQVIARFEAERQALALMDHPNIAKVHDADATETGRPYFVMELVRGLKITEFCDEQKMTTRERLELFMQVCRAVQHAHQKGIIHRDLKPSNILVSLEDGIPVPKVIDFGIAKATSGERLSDKTFFTAFEQLIGTPAYMSPEQALITNKDIDTRTDIYSLGVLLYELLTGQTPFDPKELMRVGLDEMRRTIREKEPVRPSTRLSTLSGEALSTTAQRRSLDAPKLISQLRGDLDWIVMKCLEKDRTHRYETANGLATDIQRHLNNEPIAARPPSNLYRFQKMVRRNRLVFAAGSAVVAALVFGLSFSTLMFIRERNSARRASAGEQRAEREAKRSRAAEADAQDQLWNFHLSEAHARRWSGRVGRRVEASEALKKAAAIRPHLELRNEAIACLALTDLTVLKEWDGLPNGAEFGAFDATFARYARGETNGTISVRRVEDDHELVRLPSFGPPFLGMWFSPNGELLAEFGGIQNQTSFYHLRVWRIKESQSVLAVTNEATRQAIFSHDSRFIANATRTEPNYPMHIYDLESGKIISSVELRNLVWGVDFHPARSNLLATSDGGPVVRVWDWPSGTVVQSFTNRAGIMSICWHPERDWLATACADSGIHFWDLSNRQEVAEFKGHTAGVNHLGFIGSGKLIFSRAYDGTLGLWDVNSQKKLLTQPLAGGAYGSIASDDQIGYSADRVGLLRIVYPTGHRVLHPSTANDPHIRTCAFSPDGRILASGHELDHIRFWDSATGMEIGSLSGHNLDARFHPDGERLFTRDRLGAVQEWQARRSSAGNDITFQPTRQFALSTKEILLDRDGVLMGGVTAGGDLELLNLSTENSTSRIKVPGANSGAALSPDGKLAVTWPLRDAQEIEVLDLGSSLTIARLDCRGIPRAVFSPNGRWLATEDELEFKLWDRKDWNSQWAVRRVVTWTRQNLAFSPDSSMLAVPYSREVVKLLESATGKELAELQAPDPPDINWIEFNPNGTQLAVASADGPIHLWDVAILRQQLAEMKLDWDLPPLPASRSREGMRPLSITFLEVTNQPSAKLPAAASRDGR